VSENNNYVYCYVLLCSLGPSFWCSPMLFCRPLWKKKAETSDLDNWRYFKSGQLAQPFFLSVSCITLKKHNLLMVFQLLWGHILFFSVYSLLLHLKQKHENTVLHMLLNFCTTWMEELHLGSHPFSMLLLDARSMNL